MAISGYCHGEVIRVAAYCIDEVIKQYNPSEKGMFTKTNLLTKIASEGMIWEGLNLVICVSSNTET